MAYPREAAEAVSRSQTADQISSARVQADERVCDEVVLSFVGCQRVAYAWSRAVAQFWTSYIDSG